MTAIKCCKNCVPPRRKAGCHGTCPDYAEERQRQQEDKAKADKIKSSKLDMDAVMWNGNEVTKKRNRRKK